MVVSPYKYALLLVLAFSACVPAEKQLQLEVYETSAAGNKLSPITIAPEQEAGATLKLQPEQHFQTITGFGGSFTEASAYLLNRLSRANRSKVLEAYFGESGARYSLTRTHINSCDFSLSNYSYAPIEGDLELTNFSIEEDRDDIIPMIKEAMTVSKDGFKI
ncbi:MAG: hypothetical protein KDC44_16275, partial [Phaeodactylibacter sp.]|nr:hypothetical protein [Phaeodactylibacter sp.]